jgi:hypothetical protein
MSDMNVGDSSSSGGDSSSNIDSVSNLSILSMRQQMDVLFSMAKRQLERSVEEHTQPNMSTTGDFQFRRLFYANLDRHHQRLLFLRMAGIRSFWPRIRSLCSYPPYAFLESHDKHLLNANGIHKRRRNLTYANSLTISSYKNFMTASHFYDDFDRKYIIVVRQEKSTDCAIHEQLYSGLKLVMDVSSDRSRILRPENVVTLTKYRWMVRSQSDDHQSSTSNSITFRVNAVILSRIHHESETITYRVLGIVD